MLPKIYKHQFQNLLKVLNLISAQMSPPLRLIDQTLPV